MSRPIPTRLRVSASCLVLPALFGLVGAAAGQDLIVPSAAPGPFLEAAAPPSLGTSQLAPPPPVAAVPTTPLLQWGPVQFHPHEMYRFSYGDGLQAQPGQQLKTVINEFAPGLLLNIGSHWTLDYTPSLWFYSNSHFQDHTDHSVGLTGGTTYGDWTLGLSQHYASSSQPLVETASQTEQQAYSTALNADYHINTKLSLELGLSQSFLFIDEGANTRLLQDSRQWSTMDWLNYQIWPRLGLAAGVGGGYVAMSVGSDMAFEQYQGRVSWRATDKFSFVLGGGLDDRQFVSGGQSDLLSPIFNLALQYKPFEPTTLSLTASRSVTPSYFGGSVTEGTVIGAGLQQRLLKKLTLSLNGGYNLTSYKASASGLSQASQAGREDTGTSFSASLGTPFLKRGTASVFYSTHNNSSDFQGYTLTSTQVGFEIDYRF